jgi:hypothetical protein
MLGENGQGEPVLMMHSKISTVLLLVGCALSRLRSLRSRIGWLRAIARVRFTPESRNLGSFTQP